MEAGATDKQQAGTAQPQYNTAKPQAQTADSHTIFLRNV
jgi:hypothetical protein